MNELQKRIVEELKEDGISITHVDELFGDTSRNYFSNSLLYFNEFLSSPHIKERCDRISSGNPIQDKGKWFEVTVYEYLNRGLSLDDGDVIRMNLSPEILSITEAFYGTLPKVRNILTWVHPQNPSTGEIGSQRWHRDKEDESILKVFILFSEVGPENGPTQFIKKSQAGGKYQDISSLGGDGYGGLNYEIPEGELASCEGTVGTIIFMNNNGVHKGGLVKDGIRSLTHACFLKPTAPFLNNGVLPCFEYDSQVNLLDREGESYQNLSDTQKFVLS